MDSTLLLNKKVQFIAKLQRSPNSHYKACIINTDDQMQPAFKNHTLRIQPDPQPLEILASTTYHLQQLLEHLPTLNGNS